MFRFLHEDSKVSTTRVISFMAVIASLLLILVLAFNMIYKTWKCEAVGWEGISLFLASLSTFNAPFILGKVHQKKIELKTLENIKNIDSTKIEEI